MQQTGSAKLAQSTSQDPISVRTSPVQNKIPPADKTKLDPIDSSLETLIRKTGWHFNICDSKSVPPLPPCFHSATTGKDQNCRIVRVLSFDSVLRIIRNRISVMSNQCPQTKKKRHSWQTDVWTPLVQCARPSTFCS